ncbi:MAG: cobalamin-dependent protein [Actinomycetota bacterium]|nr:cobalamin-dependent protein [Actinomycetota bacterium]MDP3630812.1 cobalamin-dependent protein [Actinomycetota bacterium]
MSSEEAARLYSAFVGQDPASAIQVIERVRSSGVAQDQLFDTLYVPALSLLAGAWASGEIDEITFTQASVVAEQIGSFVMPPVARADTGVTLVLGTMHRDRHSVMKDIVASALKESGYRVNDLGVDVRPADFLERLEETGSRIVLVFAETMATARAVTRVREMFASAGRDDAVILVAGGPFTADTALARSVGANGVITGAESALRVLARIREDLLGGDAS